MTEKEAINFVKELGMMKLSMLSDNTLYFESLMPVMSEEMLYNVDVQFYIKEGAMPTIFGYDEITNFKHSELQLAEVNLVDGDQLYFSEYVN